VFHFYIVIIRKHGILENNVLNPNSCMIWRRTNNSQINFDEINEKNWCCKIIWKSSLLLKWN